MFRRLFKPGPEIRTESLQVGARPVPLLFVRQAKARRYLLRLRADGVARVTVPRGGSLAAAREFAVRNIGWLAQQLQRLENQPQAATEWRPGTEILFRGAPVKIEWKAIGEIRFGPERLALPDLSVDLRPALEKHLRNIGRRELPVRVKELAAQHGIQVTRVTVRNQRTRWGSCSRRGTISLNWRLVQTPDAVRDYIILHELAHRRQMNHSDKFWSEVERLCPDYRAAEKWLKGNQRILR